MYISTREMVISIICNACGVLTLIILAIGAHKSNASQHFQDVESVKSVENNGDIIVRSNLEPFRVVEADRKTESQKKEVEWVYNKRERLWYPYLNGELLFKTEPTCSKMEQVDKDINVRSKEPKESE